MDAEHNFALNNRVTTQILKGHAECEGEYIGIGVGGRTQHLKDLCCSGYLEQAAVLGRMRACWTLAAALDGWEIRCSMLMATQIKHGYLQLCTYCR